MPEQASDTAAPALHPVLWQRYAPHVGHNFAIGLYLPPSWQPGTPCPLLVLNDGQDATGLKLGSTLHSLLQGGLLAPVAVLTVATSPERVRIYGTHGQKDYRGRGDKAPAYMHWLMHRLLPYVQQRWPGLGQTVEGGLPNGIFGCSLGGLSAIDIAWANPGFFGRVGVCSGSFWWRARAYDQGYTDADRIMHQVLARGPLRPGMKFWLQAGTLDEKADRNNDGIIDAIGDTLDVQTVLTSLGYADDDVTYVEVEGGRHDVPTWAAVLPQFLIWGWGLPGARLPEQLAEALNSIEPTQVAEQE